MVAEGPNISLDQVVHLGRGLGAIKGRQIRPDCRLNVVRFSPRWTILRQPNSCQSVRLGSLAMKDDGIAGQAAVGFIGGTLGR